MAEARKKKDRTRRKFTGRSDHSLDSKGRLNIPSRFRRVLNEAYTGDLVLINWSKSLKAFPLPVWEEVEEKLLDQGRRLPDFDTFMRYVISGMTECVPDRQGRILIPPSLRGEFGLERDVVLVGMLDHFEIWDRDAWEAERRLARENFGNFKEGLASLGLV